MGSGKGSKRRAASAATGRNPLAVTFDSSEWEECIRGRLEGYPSGTSLEQIFLGDDWKDEVYEEHQQARIISSLLNDALNYGAIELPDGMKLDGGPEVYVERIDTPTGWYTYKAWLEHPEDPDTRVMALEFSQNANLPHYFPKILSGEADIQDPQKNLSSELSKLSKGVEALIDESAILSRLCDPFGRAEIKQVTF